jgi:23S rRNA (adenine2503-C2)-methyltransferase
MQKKYAYGLDAQDMTNILASLDHKPESLSLLMNLIFRSYHKNLNAFTQLSPSLREHLKNEYCFDLPRIVGKQIATDETIKFLIQFHDGLSVEAVCLPFYKKFTVCLSSQVGCAMNCSFCHTATQGLKRNLTATEIVGQFLVVQRYIKEELKSKKALTNIVFMGQGEPLHNFDNLKKAIGILTEPYGIGLSLQNITVSTSGYLPGLTRLAELGGINLALSLHATKEEVRNQLIPINRRYPLDEVIKQIDQINLKRKQKVEYEYLLIKDLNDSFDDAMELANLLKNRPALVNIIPFNEFPGSRYKRPSQNSIDQFKQWLVCEKIRVMVRQTKGDEILAACGQLKS